MKNMLIAAALGLVTVTAAPGAQAQGVPARDAAAFVDMVFNKHKVAEAFGRYVGPAYTQHNPNVPDGKEAGIGALSHLVEKFPDMHIVIKRTIAQGGLVVVHYNMVMKEGDRGSAVVDIFRFEKGKITEHWDVVEPVPAEAKNNNTMF